jgi:hypothetical protein
LMLSLGLDGERERERERERENGLVPPIGMKLDKKKKKICSLKVTCCDIRLDCLCVL